MQFTGIQGRSAIESPPSDHARSLWAESLCCSMTKNQRARRVAILCCHCARNAAYCRAGWERNRLVANDDFWVSANGNFLDLAVLEWCKLFTERRGKHHWRKVVPEPAAFLPALYVKLKVKKDLFEKHCAEMKTYRDKFVAHLDEDVRMHIPNLTMAINSVVYLYAVVRDEYDGVLSDGPTSLRQFYRERLAHGRSPYRNAT